MRTRFTYDFFKNNRERLRDAYDGDGLIILVANGLLQRSHDNVYPFRQDSGFWYMTGVQEADAVMVIDGDEEFLIVPERADARAAFDGRIEPQHMSDVSGIKTVYEEPEGWKKLSQLLQASVAVATLKAPDSYIQSHGFYTNPSRARLLSRIQEINPEVRIDDLRPVIARLRTVKFPEEIEAIQESIDITSDALAEASENIAQYQYEYELDADITAHFRRVGAVHAYQPIVAADRNTCTLHYIKNDGAIREGSVILIDAGAELDMYAADITRTYSSEPTDRQAAVFRAVLQVQNYAISLLKPGVELRQYEKDVEQYIGEQLLKLKIISNVDSQSVRKYYPHATSHFLGLDVHDTGDYDIPLQPGTVLTVEPGIYIPEENFGIRIEDDVVIEAGGARVLSHLLPKSLT